MAMGEGGARAGQELGQRERQGQGQGQGQEQRDSVRSRGRKDRGRGRGRSRTEAGTCAAVVPHLAFADGCQFLAVAGEGRVTPEPLNP